MRNENEFIERRIITGLIISKDYHERIQHFWNPVFLESPELRRVANWCVRYFQKYKKAPDKDIESIYMEQLRTGNIHKADAQYIEELLSDLSDEYGRDTQFNSAYLYDQTIKYFKSQELERHQQEVQVLIDMGKVEEAERLTQAYTPTILDDLDTGLELSSKEAMKRIERAFSETSQRVISYPGAIGRMWNEHLTRGSFFSFLAPEKRGKCVIGSQKVLLSDGTNMPFINVIKNKRKDVVCYDEENQKFVVGDASDYWENGIKSVYEVTTRTGRKVTVTRNHPFLTPDGWRELWELENKENQFIAVPKECPVFGKMDIPDHVIKLLAYFITDGTVLEHSYSSKKIKGNLVASKTVGFTNSEKDIIKDFNNCIRKMKCKPVWKENQARIINSKENRGKHNKNYVIKMLKRYGLWNKHSYNKTIPDDVLMLPKDKLALFLRVLFTCDGWVSRWNNNNNNQIGYASASRILSEQIHELLTRFGVVSKLSFSENEKRGAWTVSIGDAENIKLFHNQIGFLYSKKEKLDNVVKNIKDSYKSFLDKFPYQIAKKFHDGVLFELDGETEIKVIGSRWQQIPNFRKLFKKAPSVREQINKKEPLMRASFLEVKNTNTGKKYFNTPILWDEVMSIEYKGEQPTFDITVPKYHNFIAENIIVHNSYMLMEMALRAIRQRANVAFFEAGDMTESQFLRRVCIYISRRSDQEKYCQERFRPVGDCIYNQLDTCNSKARNCDHGVFDDTNIETFNSQIGTFVNIDSLKEKYESNPDYEPCKAYGCKRRKGTVWLEKVKEVRPLTAKQAKKEIRKFFKKYKRRFKLINYSAGFLTVTEIKNCLDNWERHNGFVPDVVVIDYADLLSADDGNINEFRHRQDHIWKNLRALSQERHVLLLTATQADASSYKKGKLSLSNFSEDKRKLAHVTAQFGLNQDVAGREKRLGIMRINQIVVREGEFSSEEEVHILQDLAIGRSFLESY